MALMHSVKGPDGHAGPDSFAVILPALPRHGGDICGSNQTGIPDGLCNV